MSYIYQTTFDIRSEDVDEVRVGKSLDTSLAYLKAFLPNEPGFINARAMISLSHDDRAHLIIESVWDDWETLAEHIEKSPFAEPRILPKFDLKIKPLDLKTSIYEEVG